MSSKCDVIFAFLKECNIDREKDIENILNSRLLFRATTPKGKYIYLNRCIRYLFRRYSLIKGFSIWYSSEMKLSLLPNLLLLRLWGAILIGLLALATQDNMWELPSKILGNYSFTHILPPVFLMLFLTFLYFMHECYNVTEYRLSEIITRILGVFIVSVIQSTISTWILCYIFPMLLKSDFCATLIFFSSTSLFIGIILQIFWEEKTITEPL